MLHNSPPCAGPECKGRHRILPKRFPLHCLLTAAVAVGDFSRRSLISWQPVLRWCDRHDIDIGCQDEGVTFDCFSYRAWQPTHACNKQPGYLRNGYVVVWQRLIVMEVICVVFEPPFLQPMQDDGRLSVSAPKPCCGNIMHQQNDWLKLLHSLPRQGSQRNKEGVERGRPRTDNYIVLCAHLCCGPGLQPGALLHGA